MAFNWFLCAITSFMTFILRREQLVALYIIWIFTSIVDSIALKSFEYYIHIFLYKQLNFFWSGLWLLKLKNHLRSQVA